MTGLNTSYQSIMTGLNTSYQSYHSIEDVTNLRNYAKNINDIFIVHLNAVSLTANFDDILSFLEQLKFPDVICISETRLRDDIINSQLNFVTIPNYNNLLYDNSPTRAGGVAIYVKSSLNCEVKTNTKLNIENCESLFLELSISSVSNQKVKKPFILGCVYRHPKQTALSFVDEFCEKLLTYTSKNIPLVVLGDINIDVSKTTDKAVQYYVNTLASIGCEKNLINVHTRVFGKSKSILDHVISNVDKEDICNGVIDEPITDHMPIFAIVRNIFDNRNDAEKETVKRRFYDDKKRPFFAHS